MCDGCGHEGYGLRIEKMLASGSYHRAYDILRNIRQFIEDREHITLPQSKLVLKIEEEGKRS